MSNDFQAFTKMVAASFQDLVKSPNVFVVELDGGQHSDQVEYDDRRTAELETRGLKMLRFWNSAVMTNRDGVCLTILEACGGEHPSFAG